MLNLVDELITIYKNDLKVCDKQRDLMRFLSHKYRHSADIRQLAIDNFSSLTKERDEICKTLNYYLNIGTTQNESAESEKNGETRSSPQD